MNAAQTDGVKPVKCWGTKVADENNIIAFIGDRGTGKTSALKSFVKFLSYISCNDSDANQVVQKFLNTCKSDKSDNVYNADEKKDQKVEQVATAHFVTLSTVEPSQMGSKEGIIEVILADMYNEL